MEKSRKYLFVEQPDNSATIDFASFRTTDGQKIEDVTVKVTLTYNSRTAEPELHIYATTGEHARIVFDETRETDISEEDETIDE